MAHHHNNSAYGRLVERLNRFPQGAPPSKLLFGILKILFSEEEAGLVAELPIKPFTVNTAARAWQRSPAEARKILDELAGRAVLLDLEQKNGEQVYCLPPPMAGFFEFALMRVRTDIDQKALSELFHQYINVEEDFMRDLFVQGETGLGRVFVQEPALDDPYRLEILDYERATHVIDSARDIGISMCYCRHKKSHLGTNCDAPMDICMTFNTAAHSLIKYGHARRVDKAECHELLQEAYRHGLVQFGENNREGVNFICNCCGCCCEALLAVQRFGITQTIHSNFIIELNTETCIGCGKCLAACPVKALQKDETTPAPGDDGAVEGERRRSGRPPALNADICLGCGVCVSRCPTHSLKLTPRPDRTITPLNTTHRVVLMAAERGNLQDLIFDNQVLYSHRLMAGVLGAVLKLPPVARNLARKQLRSRYVEKIMSRM
ncbi:MAG: (Fe-S)-binding protein [Desulfovibrionaceae bacterium]|nr:MAG: (Fe-S)-binding protein [Desulfovibrionaceae bacterium]